MKVLNGSELAGYIKERQARQVRALRQAHSVFPKLAIVVTTDNPVIATYVRLKQAYGADILVDVDIHRIEQPDIPALLSKLNNDSSVHGIIIQLPLSDPVQTDELVALVAPAKDVDALGPDAMFDPATPMAILWLLSGYNVDMAGKDVLLIGRGKLVGAPLAKLLQASGIDAETVGRDIADLAARTRQADIIISATGQPGIVQADMLKTGAVVVDAGTASEGGKTVGDLAPDVYERDDIAVTPQKGGVGPLTVCALFENVIRAAQRVSEAQKD